MATMSGVRDLLDWGKHVPNPLSQKGAEVQGDFHNLAEVAGIVKTAIQNKQDPAAVQAIIHSCCKWASSLKSSEAILRAFHLCDEILKYEHCLDVDKQLGDSLAFTFQGGEKLALPAFYRTALVCEGFFFKSPSTEIQLPNVSKDSFEVVLKYLEKGVVQFPKDINTMVNLGVETQSLGLSRFQLEFANKLRQFVDQFEMNKTHFQEAIKIYKALKLSSNVKDVSFHYYFGSYLAQKLSAADRDEAIQQMNEAGVSKLSLKNRHTFPILEYGFEKIKSLKALRVDGHGLTGYELELLRTIQLQSIEMELGDHISREEFKAFAGLPITSINVSFQKHIWPEDLEILQTFPLVDLRLGPKATDKILRLIKGKQLDYINLYGSREVTDSGLSNLQGMPLTGICLERCEKITNDGLRVFEGMNLRDLNIELCPNINDEGLKIISRLPLEILNLKHLKNITDKGLDYLIKNNTPLICLYTVGCTGITEGGLNRLKKANPNLQIYSKR